MIPTKTVGIIAAIMRVSRATNNKHATRAATDSSGGNMGFCESLAVSVVSSDLSAVENRIRDVERVACLSAAPAIGSDLMRAKDYDVSALRRTVLLIARHIRRTLRLGYSPAMRLSLAAVTEVLHWQCRRCHGASEAIIGGVRQVCPVCEGTGIHRWTDKQRAEAAEIPVATWPSWQKKYTLVLNVVRMDDSLTVPAAHARMG